MKVVKKYSKNSKFYRNQKSSYFNNNDELLKTALKINLIYSKQPQRVVCKLCKTKLPEPLDFHSHFIGYKLCSSCGHINGEFDDTKDFVKNVYIDNKDIKYSSNYVDDSYLSRLNDIYLPKVNFLLENVPEDKVSVLDVGCGAGHLVCALTGKGVDSYGIDVSNDMIEYGNVQISLLHDKKPLCKINETEYFESIISTKNSVVSAIGVIEHLREPHKFFEAFNKSGAKYLYACVPMFSLSVFVENIFPLVYPRNLSGGHTHLFSNNSINWVYDYFGLLPLAEWRFGSDIHDLFRSMVVSLRGNNVSDILVDLFEKNMLDQVDTIQSLVDKNDFCSEIHFVCKKS